jgi:hypothetical protein
MMVERQYDEDRYGDDYVRRAGRRYFDISMIAVPACEMERLPVLPR